MTTNWFHTKTNFDQLVMAAWSSGLNEILKRTRLGSLGDTARIDLWCLPCISVGGWEHFMKVPWLLFLSPQLIARWRLFFSLSSAFLSKKKKKEERKRKHTCLWKQNISQEFLADFREYRTDQICIIWGHLAEWQFGKVSILTGSTSVPQNKLRRKSDIRRILAVPAMCTILGLAISKVPSSQVSHLTIWQI